MWLKARSWCAIVLLVLMPPLAWANDYRDARAELIEAYNAGDFSAMRVAGERALAARPGHAGALYNLSLAQVLDGDAAASLATLKRLLRQNVDFDVATNDAFEPLKALPDWKSYAAAAARVQEPIGSARVVHSYDVGDFIPEGIAVNDDNEVFLGSIRHGSIVRIGASTEVLAYPGKVSHWSVYGMRLDEGRLWFVSSAINQFADLDATDKGKNGVFAIDISTGEYIASEVFPAGDNEQVFGDLLFLDSDNLLLVDQLQGTLYQYTISTGALSTYLQDSPLLSPQGIVKDASGKYLYIADYLAGIYRITLSNRVIEKVSTPDDVNVYGIDGLYRFEDRLIAIQNGVQPNRVVALTLSADGSAVSRGEILAMNLPEFDEPNLGQVIRDKFWFVANSHWNRFDQDNNLPANLSGPIILEIDLSR